MNAKNKLGAKFIECHCNAAEIARAKAEKKSPPKAIVRAVELHPSVSPQYRSGRCPGCHKIHGEKI